MTDTKNTVREILDRLPDDCSLDDVLYHLYVARQVALGLAAAEAGDVASQAEVEDAMRHKWQVGRAG